VQQAAEKDGNEDGCNIYIN